MAVFNQLNLSGLKGAKRLDSEYYKQEYINIISTLINIPNTRLKQIAYITDGEHGSPIFDDSSGIRFFSAQHVKDGYVDASDANYISALIDERNKRSRLEENDILLSTVGTIGFAGLVTSDLLPANIDRHAARIKVLNTGETDPAYIVSFLNSKYGRSQTIREATGNVQLNLFIDKIREIIVPLLSSADEIAQMHREALRLHDESRSKYSEAEDQLLQEIGLGDYVPNYELSYSASLSGAFKANRVDAEFFQPTYDLLVQHITARDHYTIRQIKGYNRRGVQPIYIDDGDIKVVTSKRLGRFSIDYENLEKTSSDEWGKNTAAQVQKFDILVYTTGAYVGRTNCYLVEDRAMASNHTNILRIDIMNPIYAAVFLNSILGQLQVRRFVSGSAQAELYPSDIARFLMWDAPQGLQKEIASLVLESHEARKRAKELLDQAKRRVEEEIEGT